MQSEEGRTRKEEETKSEAEDKQEIVENETSGAAERRGGREGHREGMDRVGEEDRFISQTAVLMDREEL